MIKKITSVEDYERYDWRSLEGKFNARGEYLRRVNRREAYILAKIVDNKVVAQCGIITHKPRNVAASLTSLGGGHGRALLESLKAEGPYTLCVLWDFEFLEEYYKSCGLVVKEKIKLDGEVDELIMAWVG